MKIDGHWHGAHRVAWELHFGPLKGDALVMHLCDTPSCVAPHHLFLGTHQDNSRDMVEKGRKRGGVQSGRVVSRSLTDDEVSAIVRDPRKHKEIASEYGISASYVCGLKTKKALRGLRA